MPSARGDSPPKTDSFFGFFCQIPRPPLKPAVGHFLAKQEIARYSLLSSAALLSKGYHSYMAVIVSLRDFVDEMQGVSVEQHAYLNKVTGELTTLTNEDIGVIESVDEWSDYPAWQQSVFQNTKEVLSSVDYLELPSRFDIHEYEMMERFCLSVADEKISNALLSKIQGSGAFRRFKDMVYRYGIEEDWFRFKDEAYKEIAIAWLERHGFNYANDMNRRAV